MNVYFSIVTFDSNLFKKFTGLSKGFRKHLLHYVFTSYLAPVSDSFNTAYSAHGLSVVSRYLSLTPISFCNESGSRLDIALKVNVSKESSPKSVTIGYRYELEKEERDN